MPPSAPAASCYAQCQQHVARPRLSEKCRSCDDHTQRSHCARTLADGNGVWKLLSAPVRTHNRAYRLSKLTDLLLFLVPSSESCSPSPAAGANSSSVSSTASPPRMVSSAAPS